MPHVSMRDLAIHDNDLVVGTHGRGFWVLDDITPLRQITDEVAKADAFMFEPEAAYNLPQPSDNGTPQPKDEPLTDNPPYGAVLDYYLGSKSGGPVTLEIMNPAGESIRKYSSEDKPKPVDPNTLDIPAFWIKTPPVLSSAQGMHRWVWDLRPTPPASTGGAGGGFRGRASAVLPGTYTIKLTAGGKTYTRQLLVKMDPRVKP